MAKFKYLAPVIDLTKKYLRIGVGLFLLSLSLYCSTGLALAQQSFDKLVIFGDSLSDTGNLASVTTDFPFPFFQNRISDGPVLVDYLAAELGFEARASEEDNGDNFAVSGGNIDGDDREDLRSQVDSFLNRSAIVSSDSLYFVMMGGNDLRDIRSLNQSAAQARIKQVLDSLDDQLNRLYDAGARSFLIANVANIGRIPETLARQQDEPSIAARAEAYVQSYNGELTRRLALFERKAGVSLNVFDLFAELERILDNASALGFTQTEVGCFELDRFRFEPDCLFGTRFDRFVFFDSIHPTGRTNELASPALIARIPVPIFVSPPENPNVSAIIQLLLLE